MTERQQNAMRVTWPMVAMLGLVLAFLVGIFALIPDGEPAGRTALLGVITVAASALTTFVTSRNVARVAEKVDEVDKKVNGRMSQLIDAKTQPEPRDEPGQHRAR
jgi:hypothetical protein